jgi:hypothetical protein
MTFEQRPGLNRFVDPSIPLTWQWRWSQLKIILPIWIFTCACLIETALFHAWLSNRLNPVFFLTLFAGCVFVLFIIFGGIELQVRIRQRAKRTIQFTEKRIVIQPAKIRFFRWEKITKFHFEPVIDAPNLSKLSLFFSGRSAGQASKLPFWSMVLESPQKQELLRYLQAKKVEAPTGFEIETLERPPQPGIPAPHPLLGISLYIGGLFLLLHGAPMLLVALSKGHHDSGGDSKFTPEETARLGQFLAHHFSSRAEFRHFFLTLGIGLTTAGVALMIWGWRSLHRKKQVVPA